MPTWHLQPSALEDAVFWEALSVMVPEFCSCNEGTATQREVEWEALKVGVQGHSMGQMVGIKQTLEKDLLHLEDRLHVLDNDRVHEEEGRAGWLLAWLVHPHMTGTLITVITLTDDSLIHDPVRINAVFCDYYLALYAHPETPQPDTLSDLMVRLQLMNLSRENAELLGAEVTAEKVKLAI
ncbi:hypothetical protein NDU88_002938 [Pleurodeles waltl]|uniref:Uncharacterized protein n=1 Tax=Pleurodeles waltl TaxID=8319 RepID=A0AAV7MPF7_PLEWA|nr:hypothetical protein NDU88_002938 [Pleurodeles waltl]